MITILPDHIYHIYWNTKILQNDPSRGYGRRLLKFWSYSTFGDQWTNGLSAPPMTCVSSPTKKTNPLLPDLQLTAQPQLVSRVCLKCNFHIMPIIRWQLPAAFLLSPPHLLSPLFFKMPTSRCELSDSCTICKVELPRRYLQICNIQTLQQDPGQNLRKQNSKQAQMGILKKEGGLYFLKCTTTDTGGPTILCLLLSCRFLGFLGVWDSSRGANCFGTWAPRALLSWPVFYHFYQ